MEFLMMALVQFLLALLFVLLVMIGYEIYEAWRRHRRDKARRELMDYVNAASWDIALDLLEEDG